MRPRRRPRWLFAGRPGRRGLTGRLAHGFAGRRAGGDERLRRELAACLDRGSTDRARERAAALAAAYLQRSADDRLTFVRVIASDFGVKREVATEAARRVLRADTPESLAAAAHAARLELAAPWQALLEQFASLPEGAAFLVELRTDIRRFMVEEPALRLLEDDLRTLLASQFDAGLLELRRITWDAPASLLERLARSEAVHAVAGWDDLKNRLDPDRRFFAFFHPRLRDEPLVFIQVALVRGLADSIAPLLDPEAPLADVSHANTAIFYSISNAQPGLAGISFGGFLIKDVVYELRRELPGLRTFATLSPMPGFRAWLAERKAAGDLHGEALVEAVARGRLPTDPEELERLRLPVLRLGARYLLQARRDGVRALDPVANFHLANGALVERLNWLANPSPGGVEASLGLMVNYLYRLDRIESTHEAYAREGAVAASPAVTRLAHEEHE